MCDGNACERHVIVLFLVCAFRYCCVTTWQCKWAELSACSDPDWQGERAQWRFRTACLGHAAGLAS